MSSERVLVVGTTADYIDWIASHYPGSALFLTDPEERRGAVEPQPPPGEEILCPLRHYQRVADLLQDHLQVQSMRLTGVACYDCESMALAAFLARRHKLPYPSEQTVANCRNKFVSKSLWRDAGLEAPLSRTVGSADEAAAFLRETGQPCVLKPLSGSGSELIFTCVDEAQCRRAYDEIRQGISQRLDHRLYEPFHGKQQESVLIEQLVAGEEYSCDFMVDREQVRIIRTTRKVPDHNSYFGTTLAYTLVSEPHPGPVLASLADILWRSARALGIESGVCMVDFMVVEGRVILLELAPRPGGDCLPALLSEALGLDIIKLTMDSAVGKQVDLPERTEKTEITGLRLHASRNGKLRNVNTRAIADDPRVRSITITKRPGHLVRMPPADYDTWNLGHVIFQPEPETSVTSQCQELLSRIVVEME